MKLRGSHGVVAVAWVCAAGACGDNEPAQGEVRSGARIRAMYYIDAEGDRIPRGWFDRERDAACEWTAGPSPYCIPTDRRDTNVYADVTCKAAGFELVVRARRIHTVFAYRRAGARRYGIVNPPGTR